ncbi:rhodanese-like domain-containing protein [Rhodanobacter sp. A1T4]|jgi:rhodanese-related sulfurtransferase|uniref:rhodanese-like domain-containing protein n=1 Tax=Rhodanobacter sp. A1T4 TaxID=2723087 RepID=UPI00161866E2|nr:rhodanese-like domain-containing protein [Rhodanobacter sp. A1T4]MBB6245280.1 rhodanese-related sulfurtransferase [Rhodanobacter sp. A1T4]
MTIVLEHGSVTESFETSHYVDATPVVPHRDSVSPREAWRLFATGAAKLVDVRTAEERLFVGHVPDSIHIAWATGTRLTRNPRFVRELEAKTGKHATILLLCRSGARSIAAAEAARAAGFDDVRAIEEGFEGELDKQNHRGTRNGWRSAGLPWIQN